MARWLLRDEPTQREFIEVMDKDQGRPTPLFLLQAAPAPDGLGLTLAHCTEQADFETILEELAEMIEREGGVLIP
jgi:hypothetical protein